MGTDQIIYEPIGYFSSKQTKPYEAPRQSVLARSSLGVVKLCAPLTKDCISDLKGFGRIWIIYDFHKNKSWKPKVMPPRGAKTKKSVLATRSPYRPNSIGISCVRLDKVEGLSIYVSEHDILDGTPILDIKPYLSYADSFQDSETGWIVPQKRYKVVFKDSLADKVHWLEERSNLKFSQILINQLEFDPTNRKCKRVKKTEKGYIFSLQAWRIPFKIIEDRVELVDIYSGYSAEELDATTDPFGDKELHRHFRT